MIPARVATWLISALVGAVYGTAAAVGQGFVLGGFPLGLLLAVVGTTALLVALRALTADRWTALSGGLGVIAASWVFAQTGPGGSAIVAAATEATAWIPLTWTFAVPVVVAVVIAWPDLSRLRAAAAASEERT